MVIFDSELLNYQKAYGKYKVIYCCLMMISKMIINMWDINMR